VNVCYAEPYKWLDFVLESCSSISTRHPLFESYCLAMQQSLLFGRVDICHTGGVESVLKAHSKHLRAETGSVAQVYATTTADTTKVTGTYCVPVWHVLLTGSDSFAFSVPH